MRSRTESYLVVGSPPDLQKQVASRSFGHPQSLGLVRVLRIRPRRSTPSTACIMQVHACKRRAAARPNREMLL